MVAAARPVDSDMWLFSFAEPLSFAAAGVDVHALAARLLQEGADSFVASWDELIENIGRKAGALTKAA